MHVAQNTIDEQELHALSYIKQLPKRNVPRTSMVEMEISVDHLEDWYRIAMGMFQLLIHEVGEPRFHDIALVDVLLCKMESAQESVQNIAIVLKLEELNRLITILDQVKKRFRSNEKLDLYRQAESWKQYLLRLAA